MHSPALIPTVKKETNSSKLSPHPAPSIQVFNRYEDFRALSGYWNKLVDNSLYDSVFMRYEWFDAAWQWRKADSDLSIVTIYLNNQLIGICPLILSYRRHRLGKVRGIEFLTVPDTQHCDVITHKNHHTMVINTLARWLDDTASQWDICELRYLPETSPTHSILRTALEKFKRKTITPAPDQNYLIQLDKSWEEFYKTRSRRLKKGNNLVANHLRKAGEVSVQWIQNPDEALQAMSRVIDISAASWKKETGLTLDQPQPGDFIKTLSKHAASKEWLSIWLLYLNNKPVACEYQLIYKGNIYALRADYDETHTKLSPGTYLNWQLLQQLFETSKFTHYYLGRGDNPYKLRWTNTAEPLYAIIFYGRTFRGYTIRFLEQHVRPARNSILAFIRKLMNGTKSAQENK